MTLYLKDYFTAGNLLAGFACALFAMRGDLVMAALMMPVAMFFDAMDGLVARATKRFNAFGGEFDNVADHMSYGVAPGFLLFAAYEPVFRDELGWNVRLAQLAAFAVGAVPVFFASVRFARFNTYHYKTPGYWLGVPRPATGFALAALVNSHLFSAGTEARLGCIVLVVVFGLLNASTFPYLNHHGKGGTPKLVWFYYFFFVGTSLTAILLGPILGLIPYQILGDCMLFAMGCYSMLGWMEVPGSARRMARRAVAQAEAEKDGSTTLSVPVEDTAPTAEAGKPNTTQAALAYLLGPLTGIWLIRHKGLDAHVRFHAWQATFSAIAVAVATLALWILHTTLYHLFPGFLLMDVIRWPLVAFFGAFYVLQWVSAFRGTRFHSPFIGMQAEKQLE